MTIYSHMICPRCQHDTQVYNSRLTHKGQQVWRRRRCLSCERTFTTKERVDWTGMIQVASDTATTTTPYSRERLQMSVARACQPLLAQHGSVSEICDTIERKLQQEGFFADSPQPASIIATHATSVLRHYNPSFAIQYVQQVYRQDPPLELLKGLLEAL